MSVRRQPEPTFADSPAVTRAGWERIGAIAGGLFALTQIASALASGMLRPGIGASVHTIVAYYSAHQTRALVGDYVAAFGVFPLIWFLGGLRGALRRTEEIPGILSSVALAGGVTFAGVVLVSAAVDGGLAIGVENLGGDVGSVRALCDIAQLTRDVVAIPVAALVLATSLASFAGQLLPRWLAWGGLGLAALEIASSILVFSRGGGPAAVARLGIPLLFAVWILDVSVSMFLRASAGSRRAVSLPG